MTDQERIDELTKENEKLRADLAACLSAMNEKDRRIENLAALERRPMVRLGSLFRKFVGKVRNKLAKMILKRN